MSVAKTTLLQSESESKKRSEYILISSHALGLHFAKLMTDNRPKATDNKIMSNDPGARIFVAINGRVRGSCA